MLQRHQTGNALDSLLRNSRVLGNLNDTVRLAVPPDVWLPGDTLYVVESGTRDSTVRILGSPTTVVRDTVVAGRTQHLPITVEETRIGLRLVLECAPAGEPRRNTCNPLRAGEIGSTSYLPMQAGWETIVHFRRSFDQNAEVALAATPYMTAARPLDGGDARNIVVVPNPYVVQSAYDRINANRDISASRVMFVNVPLEGALRVYTISGQLVRQLAWTAADLLANDGVTTHGDLPFELVSADGRDMAAGLYVYVLTGRSQNSAGVSTRGKFVVIR
jgi:hypothetical protein